ncbi:MAG: SNF2-related protein [Thaumarchaeota archaeon]|nr:SNF2-related protein [Nitrososphaerota archaeon]
MKLYEKFTEFCPNSISLKIATGYFYLSAFNSLYDDVVKIINRPGTSKPQISIIMGTETDQYTADSLYRGHTLQSVRDKIKLNITYDINSTLNWNKNKIEKIEALIANNTVQVKIHTRKKFHAKVYLFKGLSPHDSVAVVGSSNFSPSGIGNEDARDGNVELNIVTREHFHEVDNWFNTIFDNSENFNRELLDIIHTSQPWINFIKNDPNYVTPTMLFLIMAAAILKNELPSNYHEDDILTEFQKIGVISADRKLKNLNGVIISDAVGLGKTYMAIELIKQRGINKTLLIIPASLKENWTDELRKNGNLHVEILSIQELSRLKDRDIEKYKKYKFVVIDEAHRLRNSERNHYRKLMQIIDFDYTKRFVLLTATPINNSILDLKNLIKIFVHFPDLLALDPELNMDIFDQYSALLHNPGTVGINENQARNMLNIIQKILAEVMVLRTRSNIASRYDSIKISGVSHQFPPPPTASPNRLLVSRSVQRCSRCHSYLVQRARTTSHTSC